MMQALKFAKGIDPIADAFAGANVRSDIYSMRGHGRALFVIYMGVGATGSSTIIVNSCDSVVPGTRTAIAYWSREILTGDTESAITRRAAAGYVYTVGSSKIILVEVDAKDLAAGHEFVELELDESVDSPCLAGVLFIGGGMPARYSEDINATVIV
jgi:hypothetical protein